MSIIDAILSRCICFSYDGDDNNARVGAYSHLFASTSLVEQRQQNCLSIATLP